MLFTFFRINSDSLNFLLVLLDNGKIYYSETQRKKKKKRLTKRTFYFIHILEYIQTLEIVIGFANYITVKYVFWITEKKKKMANKSNVLCY